MTKKKKTNYLRPQFRPLSSELFWASLLHDWLLLTMKMRMVVVVVAGAADLSSAKMSVTPLHPQH
jgi:hypothetical protein